MKITRYFQSCILVEEGNARILIDPSGQEKDRLDKIGKVDAVLFTHGDMDHFDPEIAEELTKRGATVYANAEAAAKMKTRPSAVKDGQEFEINGVAAKAIDLPHCPMWDGSKGAENTGFLLAGKFFHPGDSVGPVNVQADILALPINGPDISWRDAFDLVKQVSAKTIIPVHYDYLGGNADVFVGMAIERFGLEGHALAVGETIEL